MGRGKGGMVYHRTHCIRYADDFVVFHNTWEGIQQCKETIQEWLKGMGLELKDAKTRFAHTLEAKEECNGNVGFDFLGFTIRQFHVGKYQKETQASNYKTIIKPSKESIHRHYRALAEVIERMKTSTVDQVIYNLNPKIVGWANYYRSVVSSEVFSKLDHLLWWKLHRWAKRRHPKKPTKWVMKKYFKPANGRTLNLKGKTRTMKWHGETKIKRHIALRKGVSPYDGNWSYWGARRGQYVGLDTTTGKLLKKQGGRCTYCHLFFTMDSDIEIHHRDGNHKNNGFTNLTLLHLVCHDLAHGKAAKAHEFIHG
jgi:RNA-directed DNA polymerase